jgi:hypothetical protein
MCVRLDRSQQGVCPRTCLSQRPLKQRPTGPARGPSPNGAHARNGPPRSPTTQTPPQMRHGNGPVSPRANSPGGYRQQQYRPASPSRSQPQSPTTPTITVSEPPQGSKQQESRSLRPAVAPVRPSPLSNQTSSTDQSPNEDTRGFVFHAM